jgi:hypothetical protein
MSVQYIVDEAGKKTGVFLSLDEYEELLERAEDAEALEMLQKMRKNPIETRSFSDFLEQYSHR